MVTVMAMDIGTDNFHLMKDKIALNIEEISVMKEDIVTVKDLVMKGILEKCQEEKKCSEENTEKCQNISQHVHIEEDIKFNYITIIEFY